MRRAGFAPTLIALLALGAAACSSSSKSSGASASSTSSTDSTVLANRELGAVLDDTGLHLPAGRLDAADYRISFSDQRTHVPAGQTVTLRFRPSGPLITILEVAAGETKQSPLYQNEIAYVAIDGKDARVPVDNQLDIVASKQYPVPVT